MKRLNLVLPVMLLAILIAGGANAIPLSDLLNGGSISAGDKLFDNWQYSYFTSSDPNRSFNAGNINVEALTDGGLNPGPGLKFTASNGELSVSGDGLYAYIDLTFGFRASVLDPTLKIKDNSLEMGIAIITYNQDPDQSNDTGAYIRETVGTAAGLADLGNKNVEFSLLDGVTTSNLTDSAAFAPQSAVWVTKNILVWATDLSESATLIDFEQRFSQTDTPVPEPGTFLLLGGGLAVLVAVRRRSAKAR